MSVLICRKRSNSIFDELQSSPPSVSKRTRCSAGGASPPPISASVCASPIRNASSSFTPPSGSDSMGGNGDFLNHLRKLFPHIDLQYLEKVLEVSEHDLESAIRSLNDICLEPVAKGTDDEVGENVKNLFEGGPSPDSSPKDGSEWVDLLVRELMNSSGVEDARARAFRVFDALEKCIVARANAEATKNFYKEIMILKEQLKLFMGENSVLKRAVAIQHQRQKDFDDKNQEMLHLKQTLSQYQEQISKLEVNNYALAMHLKQAQQGCGSIPGRFHPDIF